MKKAILFLLGLILLSAVTNAQSFAQDSRVLNVGVGLWSGYYRNYYGGAVYRNSPALTVSYEQAVSRKGPGYLGLGVLLGWQTSVYRNNDYIFTNQKYYYSYRYNNYVVAARLAYHWDELVSDDIDIYGGITGGLRFQAYKFSTNYPGNDLPYYYNTSRLAVHPVLALYAGLRWYLKPNLGLFAELSGGAGIPYGTVGLTFKL